MPNVNFSLITSLIRSARNVESIDKFETVFIIESLSRIFGALVRCTVSLYFSSYDCPNSKFVKQKVMAKMIKVFIVKNYKFYAISPLRVTANVAALRSWGIRIPSAQPVNPIKKRNFYLTAMKLRH